MSTIFRSSQYIFIAENRMEICLQEMSMDEMSVSAAVKFKHYKSEIIQPEAAQLNRCHLLFFFFNLCTEKVFFLAKHFYNKIARVRKLNFP